jgi:hypothetical protein
VIKFVSDLQQVGGFRRVLYFFPPVTGICESKYNFNISTFIDHAILQSMFMLSFIFVIVCDLFQWIQICIKVFYRLFTYVLALHILTYTSSQVV